MTHAGRAASSPEIFRPFLTVCLTVFPFEFRPRTSTIGFYGKKSFISELMILECSFPLMTQLKCRSYTHRQTLTQVLMKAITPCTVAVMHSTQKSNYHRYRYTHAQPQRVAFQEKKGLYLLVIAGKGNLGVLGDRDVHFLAEKADFVQVALGTLRLLCVGHLNESSILLVVENLNSLDISVNACMTNDKPTQHFLA